MHVRLSRSSLLWIWSAALTALSFLAWTSVVRSHVSLPDYPRERPSWSAFLEGMLLPAAPDPFSLADRSSPEEPEEDLQAWELRRAYVLHIPALGVRAPVLLPSRTHWDRHQWALLEEQMQVGLSYGAVAYPHSSLPGRDGTVIVAGHSSPPDARARGSRYGSLFERLPEIREGETVELIFGEETIRYRIERTSVVPPTDTGILAQQDDDALLVLITCFPVGTTRDRFVALARKVEVGSEQ